MEIYKLSEVASWPEARDLSPEELAQAYALARAAFTADDLQRYTELEDGVPFEQVLAELEAQQKQSERDPS